MSDNPELYKPGSVVWHSSADDSGPDVGISVGLGNGQMLYAGEVPSATGPWTIAIYDRTGRTVIADTENEEDARLMIEIIGDAIRAAQKGPLK